MVASSTAPRHVALRLIEMVASSTAPRHVALRLIELVASSTAPRHVALRRSVGETIRKIIWKEEYLKYNMNKWGYNINFNEL